MIKSEIHTRDRLLDAAELLFDQYGLEATSTRQIAAAAGANSAAPNFHFGAKSKLIRELFRRRMADLTADRLERLKLHEGPGIAAVLDSFIDPLVDLARDSSENKRAFLRLLARNTVAPCQEFADLLDTEYADYAQAFTRAVRLALPQLSAAESAARFDLAIGVIARAHSESDGLLDNRRVKRLKAFVIAGLTTV